MEGTRRINRVINRFASFVKELEQGVAEVEGEIECNTSLMAGLQAKNETLRDTKCLATTVATNLRKILEG